MSAPSEGMPLEQVMELIPPVWSAWTIRSSKKRKLYTAELSRMDGEDAIYVQGRGASPKMALLEALIAALRVMA